MCVMTEYEPVVSLARQANFQPWRKPEADAFRHLSTLSGTDRCSSALTVARIWQQLRRSHCRERPISGSGPAVTVAVARQTAQRRRPPVAPDPRQTRRAAPRRTPRRARPRPPWRCARACRPRPGAPDRPCGCQGTGRCACRRARHHATRDPLAGCLIFAAQASKAPQCSTLVRPRATAWVPITTSRQGPQTGLSRKKLDFPSLIYYKERRETCLISQYFRTPVEIL
jgi:hypothetical protein